MEGENKGQGGKEEKRGSEEDKRAHCGVKGSRGREGEGRGGRHDLNQSSEQLLLQTRVSVLIHSFPN